MTKSKNKRPTATLAEKLVEWATIPVEGMLVRKQSHDIRTRTERIEVKGARRQKLGWMFNLQRGHQLRWAHSFWFVCFDEKFQLLKAYIIPKEALVGRSFVWIGSRTEKLWEQYKVGV